MLVVVVQTRATNSFIFLLAESNFSTLSVIDRQSQFIFIFRKLQKLTWNHKRGVIDKMRISVILRQTANIFSLSLRNQAPSFANSENKLNDHCPRLHLNFRWSQCRQTAFSTEEKKPPESSLIWKTVLSSEGAAASMLASLTGVSSSPSSYSSSLSAICQSRATPALWWHMVMESTWISKRKR